MFLVYICNKLFLSVRCFVNAGIIVLAFVIRGVGKTTIGLAVDYIEFFLTSATFFFNPLSSAMRACLYSFTILVILITLKTLIILVRRAALLDYTTAFAPIFWNIFEFKNHPISNNKDTVYTKSSQKKKLNLYLSLLIDESIISIEKNIIVIVVIA